MEIYTANVLLLLILAGTVCGWISMRVAMMKGRHALGWFLLGAFFGPIAILAAAMISPRPHSIDRTSTAGELERLARLHARGSLTDLEFESAKAKLLS